MSSGGAPPIFTDDDKFNGTNWVAWNRHINIAAQLKGVIGYLDGSIVQPNKPTPKSQSSPTTPIATTTTPITAVETNWESLTPTENEWRTRNAWTMALLIYNMKNPIGLGIYMNRSATEAWKSYRDNYCHKLHSAITPRILAQFPRSKMRRKALKKTF